jgi:septum formation protein
MNHHRLILASASPRRVALLKQLRLAFEIRLPNVPEMHETHLTPREIVLRNALAKARQVSHENPDALVIGADTVVSLEGEIFGKPDAIPTAVSMLCRLQGRRHQVITGVCLSRLKPYRRALFAVITDVVFKSFDKNQAKIYLQEIDPCDKAGGYAIQEHGSMIIERIEGSYSNVVGLPLERLAAELASWGVPAPPPAPASDWI